MNDGSMVALVPANSSKIFTAKYYLSRLQEMRMTASPYFSDVYIAHAIIPIDTKKTNTIPVSIVMAAPFEGFYSTTVLSTGEVGR